MNAGSVDVIHSGEILTLRHTAFENRVELVTWRDAETAV